MARAARKRGIDSVGDRRGAPADHRL